VLLLRCEPWHIALLLLLDTVHPLYHILCSSLSQQRPALLAAFPT
jgi:hypothetical protein